MKFKTIFLGILLLGVSALSVNVFSDELTGFWSTNCFKAERGTHYIKYSSDFKGNAYFQKLTTFKDEACKEPTRSTQYRADYKVGETILAIPGAAISGVKKLDLVLQSVWLAPRSDDNLKIFNMFRLCGLENWKLNEYKDVTGRDCKPLGDQHGSKGDVIYDVYKADEEKLQFGDKKSRTKNAPDVRATKLEDGNLIYYKRAEADEDVLIEVPENERDPKLLQLKETVVDNNDYYGVVIMHENRFEAKASFLSDGRAFLKLTDEKSGHPYSPVEGKWSIKNIPDIGFSGGDHYLVAEFRPPCVLGGSYYLLGSVTGEHDIKIKGYVLPGKSFNHLLSLKGNDRTLAVTRDAIGEFFLDD